MYKSGPANPFRIGLKLLLVIAATEAAIMAIFYLLHVERWLSPFIVLLIDTLTLGIAAFVAIFYLVVNPMKLFGEREKAEDTIKKSEEKIRNLFENSNDGIFVLDLKGEFIDINRTAYERLGYTKNEMLSMNIKELDSPEYADRVPERMSRIQEHGYAVFESAHRRKDGTSMPVEVNSRLFDYNGQKVYFSVIRDITDRKKADDERNKLLADITKAKKEWETTFDSATELIMLVDKNLNIIRCNKSLADFIGRSIAELLGHKCYEFLPCRDEQIKLCKEKMEVGEPAEWIEVKTDKGQWLYASHRPVYNEEGQFMYAVIILTDITDIKNAQEKISKSEKELKKRVADLERFYEMSIGREMKMKELKKGIKRLNEEILHYRKGGVEDDAV
ncbi:MAG: PAS domain S-box protein [Nitrospirae bacterium]|nr:PAS domain S-box protein [Nitrospirota bacterium]